MTMAYGWTGKILRIDLSSGQVSTIDTMQYVPTYLGGRGIASRIAWEEIPPGIDPYDPQNEIIIMTGPASGTLSPTSGRTIFGTLAPRLVPKYWYVWSVMGGWFSPELKNAGYDGIVVEGKASSPVYLWIQDGEAQLMDASHLWGKGARSTESLLKEDHGDDVQAISIGPAGENLIRFATITMMPEEASGHSGFGAVMGSKNLKAIVVKGTGGVAVAKPKELLDYTSYVRDMYHNAFIMSFLWGTTPENLADRAGQPICTSSCTAWCQLGSYFPNVARDIGSGLIRRETGACVGPSIITGFEWAYKKGGIDVPAGVAFGEPKGVELHALCDDLGMDLWSFITLQSFLIACTQQGIDRLAGETLKPTDALWLYDLYRDIAYRKTELGDILAEDLRRAADKLKPQLNDELMRVAQALEFAFGFPAHREGRLWDPEPDPFWRVSMLRYATANRDPTIGGHSTFLFWAYIFLDDKELYYQKFNPLAKRLFGTEEAIQPGFKDKDKVALWCTQRHIMIDCLPLCDMAFPRTIRPFDTKEAYLKADDIYGDVDIEAKLFSLVTGVDMTTEEMEIAGERIFNVERAMAVRCGRDRSIDSLIEPHFELPCESDDTKLDKAEFDQAMTDYYTTLGWDINTGVPTKEKLQQLGLLDVAQDLSQRGLL
jgi:aldehyde:ferredoxin oxidoreductase